MAGSVEDALFLPIHQNIHNPADAPGKVLYVNARHSEHLNHLPKDRTDCFQWHYPSAQDIKSSGFHVICSMEDVDTAYQTVLITATKQHDETKQLMAFALSKLKANGFLICAGANDSGGKRIKKDMNALGLDISESSKHKCRIIYGHKTDSFDQDKANEWIAACRMRENSDIGFITQPGLFGWNKIDNGSALLTEHIPTDMKGRVADFGCGYGYLGRFLLQNCPKIKHLYSIDADARAVEACKQNLAAYKIQNETAQTYFYWDDATKLSNLPKAEAIFDHIVMNPPFHHDKSTQFDLGCNFISSAARHLRKKSSLWLVANQHLPYEDVLKTAFYNFDILAETNGFKIIHAQK